MDHAAAVEESLLFRCLSGSRAYGMATDTSDTDVRGVFAADRLGAMTPFFGVEQVKGQGDTLHYELSKYVRLLVEQNPSVIELLWVHDDDVLYASPAWAILRANRDRLLSTRVRATYGGYAAQQIAQMASREKWVNNPQPEEPPRPRDFVTMWYNLRLGPEFNKRVPTEGRWTAVDAGDDMYVLLEGGSGSWFDGSGALRTFSRQDADADAREPVAFLKFNRKAYEARKRDWDNYWTWRRNRNPERAALEEAQGYDGKAASHLIRLLRTGREALREGVVRVRRPDADELLAIRRGEVSYERLRAMADEIDAELAEAERTSPLPREIDRAFVGELVVRMYERAWADKAARQSLPAAAPFVGGAAPDPRGRVVVLDVEGTGHQDGRWRVCEVAAVEVVGGMRTGRVFHAYVDPQGPIRPKVSRIHGLTEEFLRGKAAFAEVAPGLLAFVGDAPLVSHNAESDLTLLNHDLAKAGHPPFAPERFACTQRIARQLLRADLDLDALCDALGVDRTARQRGHAALVDAVLDAECLLRLAGMDGYASLAEVGLRRAARRRFGGVSERVSCGLSKDRREAVFSLPDGAEVRVPVPDFPAATHRAWPGEDGCLRISRAGSRTPDNPLGPAVLAVRRGLVVERWFEDGRRVDPPAGPRP